jgi:methyl-accepting chemotaxis protein
MRLTIRARLLLTFTLLVGLLAAIALIGRGSEALQARVVEVEERRLASWKLAEELRRSSDELTRMARTFVVTGDPSFERHFREILAIRAGERPRPAGLEGIHWDLVAAGETPDAPPGRAASLDERMRELGFSAEEFARLAEARDRSNALVRLEERAMNATRGLFADANGAYTVRGEPDAALARTLMHGPEYHRAKAEIMRPIGEFFALLERRTAAEVAAANGEATRRARLLSILVAAAGLLSLLAMAGLLSTVVRPIRTLTARVEDLAAGEGDLTRTVDASRRDEIGELGGWFNRFTGTVRGLVREVAGTANSVAVAAAEIAATARERESAVARIGASTRQVAVAVREIDATGHELTAAMDGLRASARASAVAADSGRSGLAELDATMDSLRTSAANVGTKFATLSERARAIGDVVHAMVRIASQTNLLSINAELEADKAAAGGRSAGGFAAVAREIRLLADRTAAAALDIEADMRLMRDAMHEGEDELALLGASVEAADLRVEDVSARFARILDEVQASGDRFERLGAGIGQQTAGIRQINEATTALEEIARGTAASLGEFRQAADRLHAATETLRNQVGRFRTERGG